MDMYEFGRQCQVLNKQYKELFGTIPHQGQFSCTREEYLEALALAIQEKKVINYFLPGLSEDI